MDITKKEKEVQKALGLEKSFVTYACIEIPVYVTFPMIVKAITEKDAREIMYNLTDKQKKALIHRTAVAIIAEERYSDRECLRDVGEEAIDDLGTISRSDIRNLDPKALSIDCIDIEKESDVGGDTIEDAKKYLRQERGIEDEHIIII